MLRIEGFFHAQRYIILLAVKTIFFLSTSNTPANKKNNFSGGPSVSVRQKAESTPR